MSVWEFTMNTNHLAQNFFIDGATNVSRKSLFLVCISLEYHYRVHLAHSKYVFHQIALKYAQKNHKVLYIARRPLERLPIDDINSTASILRNIIFRYAKTVNELRLVILELHSWVLSPRLLIIDSLQDFFIDTVVVADGRDEYALCAGITPPDFTKFCEAHCMITAATQNAVDSMSCRHRGTCASIVSIDLDAVPSLHEYYKRFSSRYFDLYYFDAANRFHAGDDNLNSLRQILLGTLNNQ